MERLIFIAVFCITVVAATATEPKSFSWDTATSKEKFEVLGKFLQSEPAEADFTDWRTRLAAAARDKDPKVRGWVANWGIRDNVDVPLLINLMAHDKDADVRSNAAITLTHWITDNGVSTCQASKEVESQLGEVLSGLRGMATAQAVVEIVGGRYSGDKPLACCMSSRNRLRVQSALSALVGTVPAAPPGGSWGDSIPQGAILNIEACEQMADVPSSPPDKSEPTRGK